MDGWDGSIVKVDLCEDGQWMDGWMDGWMDSEDGFV
jgi:hypothetical protein